MSDKTNTPDGTMLFMLNANEARQPDPPYTVSQWADRNRYLSTVASAEPGLWRTSRTPYLREIMDCLSSYSPIETVIVMKGAPAMPFIIRLVLRFMSCQRWRRSRNCQKPALTR